VQKRCRVLIVDDMPDIRLLLRLSFEQDGRFEVVGEADDGLEAIESVAVIHPDVVVLDLAMPRMDGLQVIPLIKQRSPQTEVIIYSGFAASQLAATARTLGAAAYVEKAESLKDLNEALLAACKVG
jgi:DNA-binding NarL/FixJ family response regulator